MSLAALQRDFVAYLQGDGAQPVASVRTAAHRGLPVYHHAYRASLIAALRDTFEQTHAWLGDDQFDAAARAHIAAVPPRSWTMSDFGHGFDATLDRRYPDDPETAEIAWLDWSMRRAFDGPDAPALDRTRLGAIDWDFARLTLAPTLVMRRVATNAAVLWNAMATGADAPPASERLDGGAVLTVWRDGLQPRFLTVTHDEHRALAMAQGGETFGAICAALASDSRSDADTANLAGAMLGRWIAEGLLVAVR